MIVYLTNISLALFLFRQEKGEKKPIQEGALHKTPPLEKHPSCIERPENLSNQAEMYRFPPIRPQMYQQRNSFESAAGGVHRGGRICA